MADKSAIEWTDATWNPVTGCSKVSQGCKHYYAEREWSRLSANQTTRYHGRVFTDVQCHTDVLDLRRTVIVRDYDFGEVQHRLDLYRTNRRDCSEHAGLRPGAPALGDGLVWRQGQHDHAHAALLADR